MDFVTTSKHDGIATVMLNRGKVNALNGILVGQLREQFQSLKDDPETKAVILTGAGKFFSFGFDIPEFLSYSHEQFTNYLINFADLYTYIFLYPKPVIAALNGHTIAGGCMLALACDHRVMTTGKAKIALNEIGFGSTVFAGSTEMLRFWGGGANATQVLYSGAMYSAEDAKSLGLVDQVTAETELMDKARQAAADLAAKHLPAFTSIKKLLREPIVEAMRHRERQSITEFVDIWYSKFTWANLRHIQIH